MRLRYALSQLSRPDARRAFGRTWLGVCAAGALVSVLAFGSRHAFFIVLLWLVGVFAPVRIGVEALHTRGPQMRRDLQRRLAQREARYTTPEHVTLMVESLFAREVRLPRLALPDLGGKVIEAAVSLSDRALRRGTGPSGVQRAAQDCGSLLDQWVGIIAAGEAARDAGSPAIPAAAGPAGLAVAGNGATSPALWDPDASVQDQWVTLRAVAGLAALTKTLIAVYEDSAGHSLQGAKALRALSDAAMDYTDQIGLRLDGPAWEDVQGVSREALAHELVGRLAETWTSFCAAPPPAPRRLKAFVETLQE